MVMAFIVNTKIHNKEKYKTYHKAYNKAGGGGTMGGMHD